MATFLDLAGLEQFSVIFVFLFTWAIFYVLFSASKRFISNTMAIVLSTSVAFIVVMVPITRTILQNTLPWFGVFMIAAVAAIAARLVFSGGDEAPPMELRSVFAALVFIVILIGIGVTVRNSIEVPGDNQTSTDIDYDYSQTADVLLHPTTLGIILMVLISVAAIALLSGRT